MQTFDSFWNNLDESNGEQFAEFIKKHFIEVAATLIKKILEQDEIQIGLGTHGKKQFSLISVAPMDIDKELSLCYLDNDKCELHFSFYNDSGNLQYVIQLLEKNKISIPSGLELLMKDCLDNKVSKTIRKNELN